MTIVQKQAATCPWHRVAAGALVTGLAVLGAGGSARAQELTVLPVNLELAPGQLATILTVINRGNSEVAVQVRAFAWNQSGGNDQLTRSDQVLASPPLATIAPGATQVVRLLLRRPAQLQEATYRILLDQIPPPAVPGIVQIALRLSIPIFVEPETHVAPRMQFHVEHDADQAYLVAHNDGSRHETIRDITLTGSEGGVLRTDGRTSSSYVLPGATQRWRIVGQTRLPIAGATVRLTAHADAGAVDQLVSVAQSP